MDIELKNIEPIKYKFNYKKITTYKEKSLLNSKCEGRFNLKIDNFDDNLEMVFKNEYYNNYTSNDPLVFTPVRLNYDTESNIFYIKNKEHIRQIWNKHKEKHRNKGNISVLSLFERLYFHIPLGLEYDLMSNGSYIPFFINLYNKKFDKETIFQGMDWVHSPLHLPLKTSYQFDVQKGKIIYFKGYVKLNDEKLDEIIKDKSFKNQAKSYHYTKDFTIDSNIQIAIDSESGYIISSIFQLKIHSIAEEINEEMIFDVTQRDTQNTTSFKDSGIKLNVQDENKSSTNESIMIAILLIVSFTIIILFLIYG